MTCTAGRSDGRSAGTGHPPGGRHGGSRSSRWAAAPTDTAAEDATGGAIRVGAYGRGDARRGSASVAQRRRRVGASPGRRRGAPGRRSRSTSRPSARRSRSRSRTTSCRGRRVGVGQGAAHGGEDGARPGRRRRARRRRRRPRRAARPPRRRRSPPGHGGRRRRGRCRRRRPRLQRRSRRRPTANSIGARSSGAAGGRRRRGEPSGAAVVVRAARGRRRSDRRGRRPPTPRCRRPAPGSAASSPNSPGPEAPRRRAAGPSSPGRRRRRRRRGAGEGGLVDGRGRRGGRTAPTTSRPAEADGGVDVGRPAAGAAVLERDPPADADDAARRRWRCSWSSTTSMAADDAVGRRLAARAGRAGRGGRRPGPASTRLGSTWRCQMSTPLPSSGRLRPRLGEHVEEAVVERPVVLAELGEQVEQAGGVAQDLDGLDAGEVVEEPAARRVHEQGLALAPRAASAPRRRRRRAVPSGRRSPVRRRRRAAPRCRRRAPPTDRRTPRRPAARTPRRRGRAARRGRPATAPARPGSSPGSPPVEQPQSSFHRPTPWAHDQALRRTLDLVVGGTAVEQLRQAQHLHVEGGGLVGEGVGEAAVGAAVVVAERLAVGGDHDRACRRPPAARTRCTRSWLDRPVSAKARSCDRPPS